MSRHNSLNTSLLCAALLVVAPLHAQTLQDPMQPPTAAGAATTQAVQGDSGFHLSAIRIAQGHRRAIINGKNVTVGDIVGTARVVAIQSSTVTLQQGGKMETVALLPVTIKKPVEAPQP